MSNRVMLAAHFELNGFQDVNSCDETDVLLVMTHEEVKDRVKVDQDWLTLSSPYPLDERLDKILAVIFLLANSSAWICVTAMREESITHLMT